MIFKSPVGTVSVYQEVGIGKPMTIICNVCHKELSYERGNLGKIVCIHLRKENLKRLSTMILWWVYATKGAYNIGKIF
jgi:hypothetical protein